MNNIPKNQGAVLVVAFDRAGELRKCLSSVVMQTGLDCPLIVFHQIGNQSVKEVIEEYGSEIHKLVSFTHMGETPLENININRILGYEYCFRILKVKWVLAVEDDIELGADAVKFVSEIMHSHRKRISFRGVNLGSFEIEGYASLDGYSRLSYGLHGQASAITQRTWKHFRRKNLIEKANRKPLDSAMEFYLKLGYMVTPNRSRYLDNGWNGTHAPKNPNDTYFKKLRRSWVGSEPFFVNRYRHQQIAHSWRADCRTFTLTSFFRVTLYALRNKIVNLIKLALGMKINRSVDESRLK
jgi:hypothetical protein